MSVPMVPTVQRPNLQPYSTSPPLTFGPPPTRNGEKAVQ